MAGSSLTSATARKNAKNSSVVTRIFSRLKRPIGRPARRSTEIGAICSSSSLRGIPLEIRKWFDIGNKRCAGSSSPQPPRLQGLFQRCHIDDEAILHVSLQQSFVSFIDLLNSNHFD